MSFRSHAEHEAVLLVMSGRPERTSRRLAALRRLGSYALRPRGVVAIVDTYYDTPDGKIGSRHAALRTRRAGGRLLLTLKVPRSRHRMIQDRSELELPLGPRAVNSVLRRLRRLGVRAALPSPSELSRLARRGSAGSASLVPTQRRSTRRLLRDVVALSGGRERRVAELSIDRVVYGGGLRVRLREVEIEAKDSGTARDIGAIARILMRASRGELRSWDHSKLAVGMAFERLRDRGKLENALTANRDLKPSAVPLLLRELGDRSSAHRRQRQWSTARSAQNVRRT
jgi:inorganic triphosphatase YgiF